jgi:pimeloyl-ACP methyl ester carboxylesterase
MARILLVHGAFGGAWVWEPVLPGLRDAGHDVQAIDLPGAGADATPADVSLDGYARRIGDALADGPPALLAGHSMGGMAVTQAAARTPDRVAALAYVTAFLPQDGQSLLDITHLPEAAGDQVQANMVIEGDPPIATMPGAAVATALAQCASPEMVRWLVEHDGSQPLAPMAQPFTIGDGDAAAFAGLRRAYVSCLRDRAIMPPLQRRMYTAAGCDPVIEIDTDHMPMVSATDALVAALDRIATALA